MRPRSTLTRTRRLTTAVAAAVVLAAGLGACGEDAGTTAGDPTASVGAADLAKVTLKVGDQKGGSKALLSAAGLLDDAPYRIEWSTFTSGPPLLEAASAGAVDIGGVGNTPPIFAAAAKARIAVVSGAQGSVEGDAILVPPGSPIRDVAGLRGKRVGVAKGSSAHGQLLYTLQKAGLSTKDVTVAFLQPADAYGAFTQQKIDAWAIWDPYTSQAKLEAGARVPAGGRGTANGYTFSVAGGAALADPGKNTAIRDYVVRLAKAQTWADSHREEWAAVWSKETGLKPEVTLASVAAGPDRPVVLDDALVGSEQKLADAFSDAGILPGKVDFARFVDRRYDADIASAIG